MERAEKAAKLFLEGYNCAQAVFVAYSDLTGLTPEYAAKLASSFGGGMGRLREVCGAVSGMLIVFGILYGYDQAGDDEVKHAVYQQAQDLALSFKEEIGTIICREILDNPPSDPNPTPRTEAFYKERPCARMVMTAAGIMEKFIAGHPVN